MPTEIEAKFRADGPDALDRLAAVRELGDAVLGSPRTVAEVDRYLDTADLRLASARWACRLRSRDGVVRVSLKGPAELGAPADGLHRRPEIEGPATDSLEPSAWPASPARAHLATLSAGVTLVERFRLEQQRTERSVHTREGAEVGVLTLDAVDVVDVMRGPAVARLHVVELELAADGDEGALLGIATALGESEGLVPEPRTKLEHALELLGLA